MKRLQMLGSTDGNTFTELSSVTIGTDTHSVVGFVDVQTKSSVLTCNVHTTGVDF